MLSQTTINNYIETIPPIPKIIKNCIEVLNSGDLVYAADVASEDRALMHYLQVIVNKPIFGFRDEMKNPRQIFGVFGLAKSKQLIYGYYLLLIVPKKWEIFDFDSFLFQDFQARLIHHWGKIVKFLDEEDSDLNQAISIIPATFIVCEMLFRDIKSTVSILRETKQMSYESIFFKMTGRTFFDVAALIANEWDFPENIVELIASIGNPKKNSTLLSYLRLLIIYEMSRPALVKGGLSDLFDLEQSFDDEVMNNFYELLQVEETQ